jgi:hypothetical protein
MVWLGGMDISREGEHMRVGKEASVLLREVYHAVSLYRIIQVD